MAGAKRGAKRSRGCPGKSTKTGRDVRLLHGDCLERLAEMEPESVDAIVTDPPYGLEFMGAAWDRLAVGQSRKGGAAGAAMQAWHRQWAEPAFRVLRPGGHLLAFGGTRTYHRLTCALEDAGFEIRDSIMWLYGTGFPKSLDVSKAIDKAAGAEREVAGRRPTYPDGTRGGRPKPPHERVATGLNKGGFANPGGTTPITPPASPEAAHWEGWGTALKPAHEPIVVARKPLIGTVAENVLEHGTGGIDVDGCRIEHAGAGDLAVSFVKNPGRDDKLTSGTYGADRPQQSVNTVGRWPANIVLSHLEDCDQVGTRDVRSNSQEGNRPASPASPILGSGLESTGGAGHGIDGIETIGAWECAPGCPIAELDRQSGYLHGAGNVVPSRRGESGYAGGWDGAASSRPVALDSGGGASRFFYSAKTSRAERNEGLSDLLVNDHPTVKPISLMRWLVRLVTPPGGQVLDLFLGSGSTGCAAVLEGFDFTGIERDRRYFAIAEARIRFWAQHEGREAKAVLAQLRRSQRRGDREVPG